MVCEMETDRTIHVVTYAGTKEDWVADARNDKSGYERGNY